MKRFIVAAIIALFSFTSCTKEMQIQSMIIGTWNIYKIEHYVTSTNELIESQQLSDNNISIIFGEKLVDLNNGYLTVSYQIIGDVIKVGNGEGVWTIKEIDSTFMVFDEKNSDDTSTRCFCRKVN